MIGRVGLVSLLQVWSLQKDASLRHEIVLDVTSTVMLIQVVGLLSLSKLTSLCFANCVISFEKFEQEV